MNKILAFIKNIKFTWSDLFLAVGFLFFIPFPAFSWKFMVTYDPSYLFFKNWMIITCFTISFLCLSIYLYLEFKKGNIKNNWIFWVFLLFCILSVVTVLVQPKFSETTVICQRANEFTEKFYPGTQVGDKVTVYQVLFPGHKLFFSMASLLIAMVLYIVLGVFSKRHKDFSFFFLCTYIVAVFMFVITIYSYIAEFDKYGPFFKALVTGDTQYIISVHEIHSFLVARVPYGACLMMGLMFFLIAHHLTHQKRWVVLAVFVYLNMIVSWCKTSLLITSVIIFLYALFLTGTTYKKHPRKNIIYASVLGSLFLAAIICSVLSVVTDGKIVPQIKALFETTFGFESIKGRTYIWDNIRQQLQHGWWIIGRGFGTHNVMLYPMNLVNGDNVCPSHSSYYAILGAGGVISLLGFFLLVGYYCYVFVKCWKVDKVKTMGLVLPFFAYFLYSFTEGTHHLWMSFMFPLFVYYHILEKEKAEQN